MVYKPKILCVKGFITVNNIIIFMNYNRILRILFVLSMIGQNYSNIKTNIKLVLLNVDLLCFTFVRWKQPMPVWGALKLYIMINEIYIYVFWFRKYYY